MLVIELFWIDVEICIKVIFCGDVGFYESGEVFCLGGIDNFVW